MAPSGMMGPVFGGYPGFTQPGVGFGLHQRDLGAYSGMSRIAKKRRRAEQEGLALTRNLYPNTTPASRRPCCGPILGNSVTCSPMQTCGTSVQGMMAGCGSMPLVYDHVRYASEPGIYPRRPFPVRDRMPPLRRRPSFPLNERDYVNPDYYDRFGRGSYDSRGRHHRYRERYACDPEHDYMDPYGTFEDEVYYNAESPFDDPYEIDHYEDDGYLSDRGLAYRHDRGRY